MKADPMKHALIMDEVDGMAGNEDRGGMQVRSLFCAQLFLVGNIGYSCCRQANHIIVLHWLIMNPFSFN